jgi:hypothetical protein
MNTNKKKIKLKEDSGNYITKINTDDKGGIESMKVRRTVGGFLRGAPRVSKAEKQSADSSYKKGGSVGTSKKPKMAMGGTLKDVPSDKKGLAKLPTEVRNKMGYKKMGGSTKMKMGGSCGTPKSLRKSK